jgi:hypothetical protein
MFLDRLKERSAPDSKMEKWENKGFNKGQTWQAERSSNTVEPNSKFLTKVEFGRKQERPTQ